MQNNSSSDHLQRRMRKGLLPYRMPEINKRITGRRIETNEFMFANGSESFNSNIFPVVVVMNKINSNKRTERSNSNRRQKNSVSYIKKGLDTHAEVEKIYSTRIERAKIHILNEGISNVGFKTVINRSIKQKKQKSQNCVLKNLKTALSKREDIIKVDKSVQANEAELNKLKDKILKNLKVQEKTKIKHKKVVSDVKLINFKITEEKAIEHNNININKINDNKKLVKSNSVLEKKTLIQDRDKKSRLINQITINVADSCRKKKKINNKNCKSKNKMRIEPHIKQKKCRIDKSTDCERVKNHTKKMNSQSFILDSKLKKSMTNNEVVCSNTIKRTPIFISKEKQRIFVNVNDTYNNKVKMSENFPMSVRDTFNHRAYNNETVDYNYVFRMLVKELYLKKRVVKNKNDQIMDDKILTDLKILLTTRKKALTATFKQMNFQLNSDEQKKDLTKWYYQEMLFIQQVEHCLKLTQNSIEVKKDENICSEKIRVRSSNLRPKKISSHIDLSFNNNSMTRRRSSHLISDPDVVNIKSECVSSIKKNSYANDYEHNICFSIKTETSVNDKTSGFFSIDSKNQLVLFNNVCDRVIGDLIEDQINIVLDDIISAVTQHNYDIVNYKRLNNTVEGLVCDMQELIAYIISHFTNSLIYGLNKPYSYRNTELLELMHLSTDIDISLYAEYINRPVITDRMQDEILNTSKASEPYIVFYKRLLIDSLNEALCTWRPFVYKFEPFPWQITTGNVSKSLIDQNDLPVLADLTLVKIKEWCMLVCGYLNEKEDSYMGAIPISDTKIVEHIKEDRLVKYINWEIFENEDKWVYYDLEQIETIYMVEKAIWNELLEDIIIYFI